MSSPFENARRANKILHGYREARVLITFAELGIADILAGGPATAEAVAARAGTDAGATRRLLDAGVAMDLVEREGDAYRNSAFAADVLTSSGSASLANFIRRDAAFYRRWTHLTEAVRTGRRPEANRRDEEDPNWVRDFTLALYDTARIAEPGISAALAPLIDTLGTAPRLIDVGGGHGGYSIGLARRHPGLRAVIFDLPRVIEVTREIVAATDVADRVQPVAGDFHRDPLGSGYDIALLFGVLVGEDAEGSLRLLRTVRDALRPGGYAVVRSFHAREQGAVTLEGTLADLHMLLSTRSGGAHAVDRTEAWIREAGFDLLAPLEIPQPGTGNLLVARKPQD